MIAVHKLCSTKLNSDKMSSQIYMYSWSAVLSSVIFYIVHVYTYIITTAYFIVSMHACHNLRLSSQDTVFQLWYNLSCTQWLEWCLGIFIVIAKTRFIRRISAASNAIETIDNEMICFIIFCLNCIRHGRNATYEPGLMFHYSLLFSWRHHQASCLKTHFWTHFVF